MLDLKGKNAIITGASRGIGKAVALKLAQNYTYTKRCKKMINSWKK